MEMAKIIKNCRICNSESLIPILSLGNQYITNFIDSKEQQKSIPIVPLDLVLCDDCKLLQLKHNAPAESMWNEQYWYKSGISSTIRNDLKDITRKAQEIRNLSQDDLVVDIGCNDGTLLGFYDSKIRGVGFEPSKNVASEARAKGHFVFNNFFNYKTFNQTFGKEKAKIITAISMFYDLENPNQFLEDINNSLDENGLFVIQQNYLVTMLEQNAFDNICHEHREYYSLTSLEKLLNKHGLEVFDVEQNDINGGSIRTFIGKKGSSLPYNDKSLERLNAIREYEASIELDTPKPYLEFADRINKIKSELLNFIKEQKRSGKSFAIYGASTRGNVALQYFELDNNLIDYIADKNSDKWGKKTVGTLIPIVSPEEMRQRGPDYLLVNTWHFFDEIKEQEKRYHELGGKFIVALPKFKVE